MSNSKLRVLVITSTYPRNESDYAVPWMRETHRRLAETGHHVTVLAPCYQANPSHEIDGIEVKRFRYAPKSLETLTHEQGATYKVRDSKWRQLLAVPYLLFGCIAAAWLVLTRKYDAVHVHWPFPHGIMGQVAAKLGGIPLIVMSHGAEFSLARRKTWIQPFLRQSLRAADQLIANSTNTAEMVTACSDKPCTVIPYGTTIKKSTRVSAQNLQPRILFTGRLIERKGIEYLLHAAQLVLQEHDAKFIITGDGDQRVRLESLMHELQLEEHVEFVGFLSKEDLEREYAACDMWVNPAIIDSWGDAEGLGVGSIEAYNYYKPVITTNVGGIPDTVIDGKTGYLVPQKNSQALADAMINLLVEPHKARQFGRNGFRFAAKSFSWDGIITRMHTMYQNVSEGNQYLQSTAKSA